MLKRCILIFFIQKKYVHITIDKTQSSNNIVYEMINIDEIPQHPLLKETQREVEKTKIQSLYWKIIVTSKNCCCCCFPS